MALKHVERGPKLIRGESSHRRERPGRILKGANVKIYSARELSQHTHDVYALGFEGRFVKFGFARKASRRLLELQVGSPVELTLLASITVPDEATARDIERKLHAVALRSHVRGEWFTASPKTLAIVGWMRMEYARFSALISAAATEIEHQAEDKTKSAAATFWPSRVGYPREVQP